MDSVNPSLSCIPTYQCYLIQNHGPKDICERSLEIIRPEDFQNLKVEKDPLAGLFSSQLPTQQIPTLFTSTNIWWTP